MRTIKFRGKRPDTMEWTVGSLVECFNGKTGIVSMTKYSEENGIEAIIDEVFPDTIGQYTGLKDKNGQDIYEGDIVTEIDIVIAQNRRRYQVVFETGATRIDGLILARYYDNDDRLAKRYIVEVVGNIHDNPELLKGGE